MGIAVIIGVETAAVVWIGVSGAGRGATNGGADVGTTTDGKTGVGVSVEVPTIVCD